LINYNTTANTGFNTTATSDCAATVEQTCVAHTCVTRCRSTICTGIVLGLLAALLTFTIGLLIGAANIETIMVSMAALIVFAVVLAVLIAIILIFGGCLVARRCRCRRDDCC